MDFNIFWANLTAVLNSSKLSVPDLSASDMSMYFRKSCSCEEYVTYNVSCQSKVFASHRLHVYVELFAEVAARQPQLLRGDLEVVVQVHLCRVALVTRVTCQVPRVTCPTLVNTWCRSLSEMASFSRTTRTLQPAPRRSPIMYYIKSYLLLNVDRRFTTLKRMQMSVNFTI